MGNENREIERKQEKNKNAVKFKKNS